MSLSVLFLPAQGHWNRDEHCYCLMGYLYLCVIGPCCRMVLQSVALSLLFIRVLSLEWKLTGTLYSEEIFPLSRELTLHSRGFLQNLQGLRHPCPSAAL